MDNHSDVAFLIVDDDEIDRAAVKRAFKKEKIINPILEAKNGIEALEILRGENGKTKLECPFIILLDLNMPQMNGFEFLEELRADENLNCAIVFVMTTSNAEDDMIKAYEKNIAGYIVKGDIGNGLTNMVTMLDLFWKVVKLPKGK